MADEIKFVRGIGMPSNTPFYYKEKIMPKGVYKRKTFTEEAKRNMRKAAQEQLARGERFGLFQKGHKGFKTRSMLGKHHSEGTKRKMSEARLKRKKRLGYINSPEIRQKMRGNKNCLGNKHTKVAKGKISKATKGKNNPMFGKKHTEEFKRRQRANTYLLWKNKAFTEKIFKARNIKPNKPERFLAKLLSSILPNEYKFVGDGKIVIDGLCPDFINNNGQKKIIELYGDYWHNLSKHKKTDKQRIKRYAKYGYKTLIIWEKELKNIDVIKEKILNFNIKEEKIESKIKTYRKG